MIGGVLDAFFLFSTVKLRGVICMQMAQDKARDVAAAVIRRRFLSHRTPPRLMGLFREKRAKPPNGPTSIHVCSQMRPDNFYFAYISSRADHD